MSAPQTHHETGPLAMPVDEERRAIWRQVIAKRRGALELLIAHDQGKAGKVGARPRTGAGK